MKRSDFFYHLPPELIARYPVSPRTASRLLCLNKATGDLAHHSFCELANLLQPGDLLVFNDTRVIPARLFGNKATGGKVEILIERLLDGERVLAHVRASKSPKLGTHIFLDKQITAEILQRQGDLYELRLHLPKMLSPLHGLQEHETTSTEKVIDILNKIGHIPLPHYIERSAEPLDNECYQTVYAKHPGAVAAPTAGLHFDEDLLAQLADRNIETAFVTLHVGAGTFQPVRVENIEDHVMHSEYAEISTATCEKIHQAKAQGRRVIAVGTTSVRCLETASQNGQLQPFAGETQIFIYPGYKFRCIDALITNFHLPQSTLLMLVCAFAGYEKTMAAYQEAIINNYRFFSYGDALWIA